MTMARLISEFDHLYQEQAPLRYATLQPGYDFAAVAELCARLQVDSLPKDYIALYRWKNGQQDLPDGWVSEFEEDAWYEFVPLDDGGHFVSTESAVMLAEMWREIQMVGGEFHAVFFIDTDTPAVYGQGISTIPVRLGRSHIRVRVEFKTIDPQNRGHYLVSNICEALFDEPAES